MKARSSTHRPESVWGTRLHAAALLGVVKVQTAIREERGAVMAEYGMLIAMVAVLTMGVLIGIWGNLGFIFERVGVSLDTGDVSPSPTP